MAINIKDTDLKRAASEGFGTFLQVFNDAIINSVGGKLSAETMSRLTTDQLTLVAYMILREEVLVGGFVQLIHNGYGGFFFRNPFGKMMRLWGVDELATLMNKAGKLYRKYAKEIEHDCTDDEFMALYEQLPAFDELDDTFIDNEEEWTAQVATYVDNNIEKFADVVE